MAGLFLGLAILAYLFLLIDWKSLRPTLALGGWATACFFFVVAIRITSIVAAPPELVTASAHGGGHGAAVEHAAPGEHAAPAGHAAPAAKHGE